MPSPLNPASASGFVRAHGEPYAHLPLTAAVKALLAAFPDCGHTPKGLRRGFERLATEAPKPAQKPAKAAPIRQEKVPAFKDETTGQTRTIETLNSATIRTLDGLLAAANVNSDLWRVEKQEVNKWDVTMNTPDGIVTVPNWQVKARLAPVEHVTMLTVEEIAAKLAPLVQRPAGFRPKPTGADHLLLFDLFDAHLGKLCDPITGAAYDLHEASRAFSGAIDTLVHRAKGFPVTRAVVVAGNDFFNSDSLLNATTAGTPQHESHIWQRTFTTGAALLVDVVNRLVGLGFDVDVVVVPGNHDEQRAFYVGAVLEAAFSGHNRVTVYNNGLERKYYQWQNIGLMFTHGKEEKHDDLPGLFALEAPEVWAATRVHEIHCGHTHRAKVIKWRSKGELLGAVLRFLSALSATDLWHYKKGFVGARRAATAFLYSPTEGCVAELSTTV